MNQAEIDDLLRDSAFEDSAAVEPVPLPPPKPESPRQPNNREVDSYGSDEFESYDESRRAFSKNASKNQFQESRRVPQSRKLLDDIKEQPQSPSRPQSKGAKQSAQKPRPKTGIYFYPPKQHAENPKADKKAGGKSLPYNYARLQEREKELLLTTLSEENRLLKETLKNKDGQYKKIENIYKNLLQQKSRNAPSVKQATLEKQLKSLQDKYDKLQNLCKLERQKNHYRASKTTMVFVPQDRVNEREEQLIQIVDKLKQRLISTNTQLKTLQNKLNEGQNYVDQLKRKLKRIEQLQLKLQKMAQQAQNDRQFIKQLKQKNTRLQTQLYELQKQKRLIQIQIRRYELGQSTQTDIRKELQQTRKEKEMLERNLRELASNMTNLSKNRNNVQWNRIQDSGQILRS